jgi:hypothetical protein
MYSVVGWILPARFRCMYMLAVVTGGGLGGARYAVPLYKYAEPWLHACPVTYINTYIPRGHQHRNRYVCSGTEPQCFYMQLLRLYYTNFLRVYLVEFEDVTPCSPVKFRRISSRSDCCYLVCHSSTHKMEAVRFSQTLVKLYHTTRCHMPDSQVCTVFLKVHMCGVRAVLEMAPGCYQSQHVSAHKPSESMPWELPGFFRGVGGVSGLP